MADYQEQDILTELRNKDYEQQRLEQERQLILKNAFQSDDADTIVKASNYYNQIVNKDKSDAKSILLDTYNLNSGNDGWRERMSRVNYDTLTNMARTPIINAIIKTRIEQVASFTQPQPDKYSTGFVIREKGQSKKDHNNDKEARRIMDFVLNCGTDGNAWHADDFESFIRKIVQDSMIYDQLTWENVYTRGQELNEFFAVDASTIRIANTYDDNSKIKTEYKKKQGYWPSYVQLHPMNGTVHAAFYPWELCFGVRNPSSSIYHNGYGRSELEDLIKTITSILNAESYNSNFFTNGSNPKGIIKVSGDIPPNRLDEFKSSWQSQIVGAENSHKTPIINADKMDFVSTQQSNRDMEFQYFMKYLMQVSCAIYKISPEEVGFDVDQATQKLSDSSNEAEVKYSKDKGLNPLLRFIEKKVQKYVVNQINDKYEIVFAGLNAETAEQEEERVRNAVQYYMTVDEARQERGLKPLGKDNGGEIIMNPVYLQNKQAAMMGDQESNEAVDNMDNDEAQKAVDDNPMIQRLQNWIGDMNEKESINL